MTLCYIGIGANDEAEKNTRLMIQAIHRTFGELLVSTVSRTSAEGISAPDYCNAVVFFNSNRSRSDVRGWCRGVEERLGRVRGDTLCCSDLDLLLWVPTIEDVCVDNVREHYFRPLVEQLLCYQTGSGLSAVNTRVVALDLGDGQVSGRYPSLLKGASVMSRQVTVKVPG